MSVFNQTYESKIFQDNVKYLQSFSCIKDLSAVEGFYVRLM